MVYSSIGSLILLSVVSFTAANIYYPTIHQNYNSSLYPPKPISTPCKTKVSNKAPVYDLCYWNQIEYEGVVPNNEESVCNLHGAAGNYIDAVNIPSKFLVYNGQLFFNVKRLIGVSSTLNVITLNDINNTRECPKAKPYPNVLINELALPECTDASYYLTNVQDFDIDKCGVLWALDVGSYCNNTIYDPVYVQDAQICLYNTAITDSLPLVKCIPIPEKYYNKEDVLGFTTILVNSKYGCDKSFVYIFNTRSGLLLVYSTETGAFWGIRSITFELEPFYSYFNLLSSDYIHNKYVVTDGVSATLDKDGIVYKNRAGKFFYRISYQVLHEPQSEFLNELNYKIEKVGASNERGQFGGLVNFDNQFFGIQELNHAVVCFTPKPKVDPEAIQFPVQDRELYPFLSDLQLYSDNAGCQRVYFLSNNLIEIKTYGLDVKKRNFKFFYIDLKETLRIYPECKAFKDYSPPKYVKPYVSSCHAKERLYPQPNYRYPPNYIPNYPVYPIYPSPQPSPSYTTTVKPATTTKKYSYVYY